MSYKVDWKNTKEFGDQDTIGQLTDSRFFWAWNTGAGKSIEELLEMGEDNGENGGKVFDSLEELLDYLENARDDLTDFVRENF